MNNALNEIRKNVQKNLPSSEKKYFFHSRKLFLSKMEDLNEEQLERLNYLLINYSEDLRIIYCEKENLLRIIHSNDSNWAINAFNQWVKNNLESDIIPLKVSLALIGSIIIQEKPLALTFSLNSNKSIPTIAPCLSLFINLYSQLKP